jgi:hypothetical protein
MYGKEALTRGPFCRYKPTFEIGKRCKVRCCEENAVAPIRQIGF